MDILRAQLNRLSDGINQSLICVLYTHILGKLLKSVFQAIKGGLDIVRIDIREHLVESGG